MSELIKLCALNMCRLLYVNFTSIKLFLKDTDGMIITKKFKLVLLEARISLFKIFNLSLHHIFKNYNNDGYRNPLLPK